MKLGKEFLETVANMNLPKPKTNADRIRAMTDEELARWIATTADDNCPDTAHERYCDNRCGECWRDWLKSPVEVDNGT